MIIGRNFLVKINANIGNSAVSSSIGEEVDKLRWATRWGADTVMDLSTGNDIHETREWIIRNSPVPIGTVPIYQALEKVKGKAEDLNIDIFLETLIEQAEQGVDYFTIHAGVLLRYVPLTAQARDRHRVARRVDHGEVVPGAPPGELPLHALRAHLRGDEEVRRLVLPGRRAAARARSPTPTTRRSSRELETLGELTQIAWKHDVQVMIEGPGHVPMHKIKENIDQQLARLPRGAVLHAGAAGDRHRARLRPHHVGDRRGDDRLVRHGDALLRHAQGAPRAAQPQGRQGRRHRLQDRGARRRPGQGAPGRADARRRAVARRASSSAGRTSSTCRWIPTTAREFHDETLPAPAAKGAHFCSMCGPHFCSMKITQDVRDYAAAQGIAPDEAVAAGLREKAAAFREQGQALYVGRRAARAGSDDAVSTRVRPVRRSWRWPAAAWSAAARPATIPGRRWRSTRRCIYAQMCARCHGADGRGDPEIKKTMPNVRDFHDPAFRARATTDAIVTRRHGRQGTDAGVRRAASACPRCRRCPATCGGWAPRARLRGPRRDGAAGGGRARRRLLLSGRERRGARQGEEAQAPHAQAARRHGEARRAARLPRGAPPQARQRAGRRRGLPGGDRRVHEGLRAARRSGRAVQPRRVLPPHRRQRKRRRRLPRVSGQGPERAQPRGHRGEDRRRWRRRSRRARKPPPKPRRRRR